MHRAFGWEPTNVFSSLITVDKLTLSFKRQRAMKGNVELGRLQAQLGRAVAADLQHFDVKHHLGLRQVERGQFEFAGMVQRVACPQATMATDEDARLPVATREARAIDFGWAGEAGIAMQATQPSEATLEIGVERVGHHLMARRRSLAACAASVLG